MKTRSLLSLLVCSLITSLSFSNRYIRVKQLVEQADTSASMVIDNPIFNFGLIGYNSAGKHLFVITNKGKKPLIIYNCIKGCGCTSVEWTQVPILPGQKGYISATYNTKIIGHFSRGVDVYTNDPANPKVNIKLKGEVMVLPGGEAPPILTEKPKSVIINSQTAKPSPKTAKRDTVKW